MAKQVIIQQAGPLPIQATFQAPGNQPMYLEVNGSVWSQSVNVVIGIGVTLDDQKVGAARVFSNGNATHRSVVPAYIPIKLKEGATHPHALPRHRSDCVRLQRLLHRGH